MSVFLAGSHARANWDFVVGTAGFFGQSYIGGMFDDGGYYQAELSVGSYTIAGASDYQLNVMFRAIAIERSWDAARWKVLAVGTGFVYALIDLKSNNYFSSSPREFPDSGYYEQTALRGVLEISTQIDLSQQNLGIGYYLRLLDKGLGAYHNSKYNDLAYYTSSGLAVIFSF